MLIRSINGAQNRSFGIKYKLSKETVSILEASTGLSYKEMTNLSLIQSKELMNERVKINKPSRLKIWFSNKYKSFGEKFGFLKK